MQPGTLIIPQNNWQPFTLATPADYIRPLGKEGGVEDRLRVVAFAEVQAREAFRWGAERFPEAPAEWREQWLAFAHVEERHAQMLLGRMAELGFAIGAKTVSDKLYRLCIQATDPVIFLFLLSSAEERGMEAGMTLGKQMQSVDPISARIFQTIAEEEVEHVAMANKALSGQDLDNLRQQARILSKRSAPDFSKSI